MLRFIANKCTKVMLKHRVIREDRKAVYIYGFELFWSTTFCVLCVLSLGAVFHYLTASVLFLVCFMPIRFVAGGYHAKSYGQCFLFTNLIAISCVWVSRCLWLWSTLWLEGVLYILYAVSAFYIWRSAPVNSKKYSLTQEELVRRRLMTHRMLCTEVAGLVLMRMLLHCYDEYIVILTTCAVAALIYIEEKGEK